MKLFFALFAAAVAAPVSAEIYFKEQFNDDVSFHVLPINAVVDRRMIWAGLVGRRLRRRRHLNYSHRHRMIKLEAK